MINLGPDQRPEGWSPVPRAYDSMVASFTGLFAQDALRLANVQPGQRVLDVGAGTGVLSLAAAALGAEVLATDFSPGMVDYLKGKAQAQGIRGVEAVVMDGQALDVADNRFDAVFSIFGLMFFPDRAAGFRELHRVTRPKGLAVVASWSSMERLRFAQAILGTLREAVPDLPTPTKPPPWLSLADRAAFKALPSLSPAFSGILGSLQSGQREAFRTAFVRRIRADQGDGPFGLEGEAHIAVGTK
jgi:ubiquinone/menaquinone biosynthesis C-methylase UbiE